jgi:hypothetical protein
VNVIVIAISAREHNRDSGAIGGAERVTVKVELAVVDDDNCSKAVISRGNDRVGMSWTSPQICNTPLIDLVPDQALLAGSGGSVFLCGSCG